MASGRRGRLIATCLGCTLATTPARAQPRPPRCETECTSLTGTVRAAGERQPVPDATVVVVPAPDDAKPEHVRRPGPPPEDPPWIVTTQTDAAGHFETPPVPGARARVILLAPGFLRDEFIVEVGRRPLRAFVAPDPAQAYRTEVRGPAQPTAQQETTRRRLEAEELRTLPGSQGDPLRGLQNMPGVVRAPGGLGVLILRGAAPVQSRVFFGGLPLPRAFHALSLASVFPTDIIDTLDFVPGNFDARYGSASGGIVVIEPRAGRRDGVHGHAEVDLAAASALVEGPLRKGSWVIAAQRGYVDAVVAGASAVSTRVTGEPNDLLLPGYYDYQALLDYPLPEGTLGVHLLGAGDRLRAQAGREATAFDGDSRDFEFRSGFHRLDVPYTVDDRRGTTRFIPSVRILTAHRSVGRGVLQRRRTDVVPAARLETQRALGRRASLLVGTDFEVTGYRARDEQQPFEEQQLAPGQRNEQSGIEAQLGVYSTLELRLGPVTLRPGTRVSTFTSGDQARTAVDPRVLGHLDLGDAWRLSAGVGRYTQMRPISDRDRLDLLGQGSSFAGASLGLPFVFNTFDPEIAFAPEDTQLTLFDALQASGGAEYRFGDGWSASAVAFARLQDNGDPRYFEGEPAPESSRTRTAGAELLVRRRLTARLYGWLGYTFMLSQLRFFSPLGDAQPDRPSDFDQRHNFVALASYELPRGFRVGGRFRVTSGFPYRPVVGSVNVRGGFLPVFGDRNTARLGTFHQLDLRVDKRWTLRRTVVWAYVDVQNVYNRVNPEAVLYSPDFRAEVGTIGLPIFPTLGVRVEF